MEFKLHSQYQATGDQPQAIEQLVDGVNQGVPYQTLLGVAILMTILGLVIGIIKLFTAKSDR